MHCGSCLELLCFFPRLAAGPVQRSSVVQVTSKCRPSQLPWWRLTSHTHIISLSTLFLPITYIPVTWQWLWSANIILYLVFRTELSFVNNGLHFTLVHNFLCIQRIKLLLLLFQWKKEFTISKTFVATPLGDLEKKAVLSKNHILIEWVFLFRCGYQSSFIWGGKVKIWLVWWLPGNGLGFGDDLTGIALSILIVQ